MHDCYRYCTACTRWSPVTLQRSPQRRHCWLLQVLSQSSGEGDYGLQCYCYSTYRLVLVWDRSRSQPRRQLTSQFWSGSANQFSHKLGQPASKPVDRLWSRSGCESGRNIYTISFRALSIRKCSTARLANASWQKLKHLEMNSQKALPWHCGSILTQLAFPQSNGTQVENQKLKRETCAYLLY